MTLTTPVVFLIFNRPDTTQRVFDAIRLAQPKQLLVIADGPRASRLYEAERCQETRQIIEQVDWDCEVSKNYTDVNLGCKQRVSSGLDWAFSQVEEAIILEDDCLPHPTFFPFCEELLERYRLDQRIMAISGDNFQAGRQRTQDSYYFSRYNHIWGWATWRRAWKFYDVTMAQWPIVRDQQWLNDLLETRQARWYWSDVFQAAYEGKIDTWDYAWTFACWIHRGLTVLPKVNLISNIGFGTEATHTTDTKNPFANLPTQAMLFPLRHPPFTVRDATADKVTQETVFRLSKRSSMKFRFYQAKSFFDNFLS